ncbi:hypothetical protein DNTS_009888 [Danionella cerebrum]|uniref:Uncharacterized protein n=1 Tax=Danionella cerebrum TaxID=2873325 RepID=A0A553NJQ0_9TELE|nr:hypothetical protein DNTS_009888 [Danionella translucida]
MEVNLSKPLNLQLFSVRVDFKLPNRPQAVYDGTSKQKYLKSTVIYERRARISLSRLAHPQRERERESEPHPGSVRFPIISSRSGSAEDESETSSDPGASQQRHQSSTKYRLHILHVEELLEAPLRGGERDRRGLPACSGDFIFYTSTDHFSALKCFAHGNRSDSLIQSRITRFMSEFVMSALEMGFTAEWHTVDAVLPPLLLQPEADLRSEGHQRHHTSPVTHSVLEDNARKRAQNFQRVRLRIQIQPPQHP